ncbi:MAG: preprotein translocase subunit Sec61beta [Candidatus Woesearchaeota archaeon]|jgi:preprotein translocase subunit Sec61beta
MADNKINIPSSQGGLVRFSEDLKSKIAMKPEHVILLVIVLIVLEIILHTYGTSFLGL